MKDRYDAIVVGSGLAGLTAANNLARSGCSVLLAEQHSRFGGLATFFHRKSHVLDVALHGFPVGMKKSFRKYWGKEFSDRIKQVSSVRFDNPQFQLQTTFNKNDFRHLLSEYFGIDRKTVQSFFDALAKMNYYDDQQERTHQLFERYFPGRDDVWRLLMEPITYANGSTLHEPAVSYGIVFNNFMNKGVYTFQGGTDCLITMMEDTLRANGVDAEKNCLVEKILIENNRVAGAMINGREIGATMVLSNGNLLGTARDLVGLEHFDSSFREGISKVRLSNSSTQAYIGIKPGEKLDYIGDLLFTSSHPVFDADALSAKQVTSRTYSVYYPSMRPGTEQYTVVASMNARYEDWAGLDRETYRRDKQLLIEDALNGLEPYVPDIRRICDYTEAATPCTFKRYTLHDKGASFGTKFEGLYYSSELPKQVGGLFHAGSVGIIMSGWLGAVNYGMIAANDMLKYQAGL